MTQRLCLDLMVACTGVSLRFPILDCVGDSGDLRLDNLGAEQDFCDYEKFDPVRLYKLMTLRMNMLLCSRKSENLMMLVKASESA